MYLYFVIQRIQFMSCQLSNEVQLADIYNKSKDIVQCGT